MHQRRLSSTDPTTFESKHSSVELVAGSDLVDAIRAILYRSPEPLTVPKIRERLPESLRTIRVAELTEVLQRQVAAHVLVICPKYRSAQDRYWDRPLREHAKVVLRESLTAGPASWSELRKKFPKYLRHLAESVLNEELARGTLHRHPPESIRKGPRIGLHPADVRVYAERELQTVLRRLEQLGFAPVEVREAMMHLLNEEEWGSRGIDSYTDAAASIV